MTGEGAFPDPSNPSTPTYKDACTYTGLMSDIFGSGENHTTFTTLQFNFKADEEVTNFSYYFGINLDEKPWWTDLSKECTPYASEFSVVVNVKDLDLKGQNIGYCIDEKWHSDRHLEFQNCYAANGETKIPVTLTSITVNGTSDTSNGTKPVDPDNPNILREAMADKMDIIAIDDLAIVTNMQIEAMVATPSDVRFGIERYYGNEQVAKMAETYSKERREQQNAREKQEEANEEVDNAPIVLLVNKIIEQAVNERASDIHIEALEDSVRVRFRIDGVMQEMMR